MNTNYFTTTDHYSTQLQKINDLLSENTQVIVSFWGKRVVKVISDKTEISFDLDEIVGKIRTIIWQKLEANDFSSEERIAGIEIEPKLIKFYEDIDAQYTHCCYFTKILLSVRDVFRALSSSSGFSEPDRIANLNIRFSSCLYSKEMIYKEFPIEENLENPLLHPKIIGKGFVLGKDYYEAKEEAIREKIN
jgi:hypothetical protein